MKNNMYFSVDIETDGEAPGDSSMLSIGVVALDPVTFVPTGEFYRTLKRLPEARPRNATMEWWDQHPESWAATRAGASDPKEVMQALHNFVVEQGKTAKRSHAWEKGPVPVFVASPASFDFAFVYYYLHRFLGESVFGFAALDIKSYAMALMDVPFSEVKHESYLLAWKSNLPHTHHALVDARAQADIFVRMLRWRAGRKFVPARIEEETS